MESEPKDVIVLNAIHKGSKNFNKVQKITKIDGKELEATLESLDKKELIVFQERKSFFGMKKEIVLTKKGERELQERKFELQTHWDQMVTMWKEGDKQKLQQYVDNNRSFLPSMMFLGVMDILMFSTMMGFMGMTMASYLPADNLPSQTDSGGHESHDTDGTDTNMGGDGGGGFDIDIGF